MVKIFIGVLAGGAVGFVYNRFIGCKSGACLISKNPYLSTLYWAVLGGLIARIL